MLNLSNKNALLVGAKRVGATLGRRLAREGVNLAIAYRGSQAEATQLRDSVADQVERSFVIQADVSEEDDVKRLIQGTVEHLGGLDFVVNLASDFPRTPFDQLDGAAWDRAMASARGTYLLTTHAARQMAANPGPTRGHIVLFGDWAAGETPYANYLPYLTAKAAIDFMTRGFAVELASRGVLVNAIAPGPTMRPPDLSEQVWQSAVLDRAPLKRESSPGDIAEMIVTLLKSETITGDMIRIDSGRHLAGPGAD